MDLISPPGYGAVVPYNKETHAKLGINEEQRFSFAKDLNALFITATEFVQAVKDYAIVFSANEEVTEFVPMLVTGLSTGENRFVDQKGNWEKGIYIPAYVRRYPFCVVEINDDKESTPQQLVCVDESALTEDVTPFFDDKGESSEAWKQFQAFMQEYESARVATIEFTKKLAKHDLFEVFEARAKHISGEEYHMVNMYRVNEKKLNKLTAKVLKELMAKNYMYFIYAHLMSLDNFQGLLDRQKTH